jgi:hypothetical protein
MLSLWFQTKEHLNNVLLVTKSFCIVLIVLEAHLRSYAICGDGQYKQYLERNGGGQMIVLSSDHFPILEEIRGMIFSS